MTLAEYLDPKRFPLTTQDGLPPAKQVFIDCVNIDALAEWREAGNTPDPDDQAQIAELDAKKAAMPEIRKELSASGLNRF